MRRIPVAALLLASVSAPALAQTPPPPVAQLSEVRDTVLVDTGNGYNPVTGPISVKVGDQVLVTDNGQAVLTYGPDCTITLEAPSTTVVDDKACVKPVAVVPVAGGLVAAALLAGGGAAIIVAADDDDDDNDEGGFPATDEGGSSNPD